MGCVRSDCGGGGSRRIGVSRVVDSGCDVTSSGYIVGTVAVFVRCACFRSLRSIICRCSSRFRAFVHCAYFCFPCVIIYRYNFLSRAFIGVSRAVGSGGIVGTVAVFTFCACCRSPCVIVCRRSLRFRACVGVFRVVDSGYIVGTVAVFVHCACFRSLRSIICRRSLRSRAYICVARVPRDNAIIGFSRSSALRASARVLRGVCFCPRCRAFRTRVVASRTRRFGKSQLHAQVLQHTAALGFEHVFHRRNVGFLHLAFGGAADGVL